MMQIEQTVMLELPVYQEDLDKIKAKKPKFNCLQDQFIELLNSRKVELAEVQRATKIPWGTLQGWYAGDVNCQMADGNLLALARFFNVTVDYLVYGIGDDTPAYEKIDNKESA